MYSRAIDNFAAFSPRADAIAASVRTEIPDAARGEPDPPREVLPGRAARALSHRVHAAGSRDRDTPVMPRDRGAASCVQGIMKRWLWCSIVIVVSCGGTTPPPRAHVATSSPEETSSATSCTRDDECFCRVFDGARFQPGREPSNCCRQPAGCTDAIGASVQAGHCMTCVYD